LALENFAFATEAVSRLFAFPDRDLAQPALYLPMIFKATLVKYDVLNVSSDLP
jgi:hypothetical protein